MDAVRQPRGRATTESGPDGITSAVGKDLEAEDPGAARTGQAAGAGNEILRRATAYFARGVSQMMYPLVLDLAAEKIAVAVTRRVLGLSKQALCNWRTIPVRDRDYDDVDLFNAAVNVNDDDVEFGYRFNTDELVGHGWTALRNCVNTLCTMRKLWSVHARRHGRHRKSSLLVHDDLVGGEWRQNRDICPAEFGRAVARYGVLSGRNVLDREAREEWFVVAEP